MMLAVDVENGLKKFFTVVFITAGLSLLSACGHSNMRPEGGLANAHGEGGLLNGPPPQNPVASNETDLPKSSLDQAILGVHLQNKEFDIPVVYNQEVENWVEYFTGPGHRYFSFYLERMGEYKTIIEPKLKAANMPLDLIYLAMIESGFSTQAKSYVGAVGQWQFMRSTGRHFGLRADWWVDERRDPAKSTDAAIDYLRNLHDEFGSWELAAAAYNSGGGRIRNAIRKLHTHDFWEIARNRRALRRETKDYVPKMMAAAILGKNPELFGFHSVTEDARWQNTTEVVIPKAENLRVIARAANLDLGDLRSLNPELTHCCTPPKSGPYSLRVPKGEAATLIMTAIAAGEIGRYKNFQRHVIRRGDTLSRIAINQHVPVEAILAINDLQSARRLKPGTEIMIPEGGSSQRTASHENRIIASEPKAPPGRKHVLYVVQKGDTLSGISQRYSVRVDQIRAWNSLHHSKFLTTRQAS